jgi:hypothetical protein
MIPRNAFPHALDPLYDYLDSSNGSDGTKNGSTVVATELGAGGIHKTVITLTATPITLTDDAGVGQYGGVKLYDFPAGSIKTLGATIDADLTLTNAAWIDNATGNVSLGSAAPASAIALATTKANMLASTVIAAMTAQVGAINASTITDGGVAAAGTTDADLYLNIRIDDNAAHITDGGTITGTVTIFWINTGDF